MNEMLSGAIALGSLAVGLFFFKYWYQTRDRFFLYFALSFGIEAINRVYAGLNYSPREDSPAYFIVRLVSYGLILLAIWEKNRPRSKGK
ncbi:MAG: hypothetical protein JWP47_845 [Polaromonas sp.]|nr:hypothetical protein [Polaromonas sp.]